MLETHCTYYEQGDILIRAKGLFDHMGVFLGNGMVLHNTPDKGVHISSVEVFANGKKLRAHKIPARQRHYVLQNAHRILRSPQEYSLFFNNCDHTVTSAVEGKAYSNQLLIWGIVALSIGVTVIAIRH